MIFIGAHWEVEHAVTKDDKSPNSQIINSTGILVENRYDWNTNDVCFLKWFKKLNTFFSGKGNKFRISTERLISNGLEVTSVSSLCTNVKSN